MDFNGKALKLSNTDINNAALSMNVTPAIIHAVKDVESGNSGFLEDGRPQILFEAHYFYELTKGKFGSSNISSPVWDRSLYGVGGAHQYDRLEQAMQLDEDAALRSCSWGLFQIMGDHWDTLDYPSVDAFVEAQKDSEANQLNDFIKFCKINHLDNYLRDTPPDFASFAYRYNGSGYRQNGYDTKLAASYRKWLGWTTPNNNPNPKTNPDNYYSTLQLNSYGPDVRNLQIQLNKLGFHIDMDGDYDPETLAAVVSFQKAHNLIPDGIVGANTRAVLANLGV